MQDKVSILEEYRIKAFKMVMYILILAVIAAGITSVERVWRTQGYIPWYIVGVITVELIALIFLEKKTVKNNHLNYKLYHLAKVLFIVACVINYFFLNFMEISVDVFILACPFICLAPFFIDLKLAITTVIILQIEMLGFVMVKPSILNELGTVISASVFIMISVFICIFLYFIRSILVTAKEDEYKAHAYKMQNVLDKVTVLMKELSRTSQSVAHVVEKESAAMQEIAAMSEGMIMSNQEMLKNSEQNRVNIEYIGSSSQNISDKVQETQTISSELVEISSLKEKELNEALVISKTLEEATNHTLNRAEKLQDNTNRIDHLMQIIKQVAEETNLLALNASIEAARAGEAGKGFAVVAQQVKNLSESTKKSLENVNHVIQEFKMDVEHVEGLTKSNTEQIKNQNETITKIVLGMKEMIEKLKNSAKAVQEVDRLSRNQNESMKKTVQFNEKVVDGIKQEIKRFENIDQLLQENKLDIENIVTSMNELGHIVFEIEALL